MSYAYLDDGFPEHEKVAQAGGDAAWLYVCGLCYVNRRLSGGRIPKGIVPQLSDRKRPAVLATKLVEVGLWEDGGDHFVIHDYATFNASAERKREARIQKAKKAAEARWAPDSEHPPSTDDPCSEHAPSNAPSVPQASPEHPPSNAQASPPHASALARAGVPNAPTPLLPNTTGVESVSEVHPVKTGSLAPDKPAQRRQDLLFEAVAEATGTDWRNGGMTTRARQALNAAVADLRQVEADPDEVPVRAARYRRRFPDAPLTANALAKHWPALASDGQTTVSRHQRGVAAFMEGVKYR